MFLRLLLIASLASAASPRAPQDVIDPVMRDRAVVYTTGNTIKEVPQGVVCLSADDWYHAWQGMDTYDYRPGIVCMPRDLYLKRAKLEGLTD